MLYLQNTWTPGKGKNFKSIDPSSGEIIWEGNFATSLQINTALKSSNQAHRNWSVQSFSQRLKVIQKFYSLLEQNKATMSKLITSETGKVPVDAASEVGATLAKLQNSVLAYQKRTGSQSNKFGGMTASLKHASHGVLSVIGPFNLPDRKSVV